jgi:hypothetical protein
MPQSKTLPLYTLNRGLDRLFKDLGTGKVLPVDVKMYDHLKIALTMVNLGIDFFETQEGDDADKILFKKEDFIYTAALVMKTVVNELNGNTLMFNFSRDTGYEPFNLECIGLCEARIPKNIETFTDSLIDKSIESIGDFIDETHIEVDRLRKMKPQLSAS